MIKTSPQNYSIHGLNYLSEIPLDAVQIEKYRSQIQVLWTQPRKIPKEIPEGDVIQKFVWGEENGLSVVMNDFGIIVRIFGLCEFNIDMAMEKIHTTVDTDQDPRWASLFLAGVVSSLILMKMGRCVLHASAVFYENRAIAFVTGSGMGKSTLAALFCFQGAELVTDDVLHLGYDDKFFCHQGMRSLRLRKKAPSIVKKFDKSMVSLSVDDRYSLLLGKMIKSHLPLDIIIVPRLLRSEKQIRSRRLQAHEAFLSLMKFPRILGIVDEEILRSQFYWITKLVKHVPVFEVDIPWSESPRADLPRRIMSQITAENEINNVMKTTGS
ncbi:MAG: hypothetical protein MUP70_10295 [Candidatus Aminicenantes bacterium]|nr:hypothetical protein [Candidatus Aminicenantes bacterium]